MCAHWLFLCFSSYFPMVKFDVKVLPLLCCGTHYSIELFRTLKVEFPLQCLARSSSGWCDDIGGLCSALILLHHIPGDEFKNEDVQKQGGEMERRNGVQRVFRRGEAQERQAPCHPRRQMVFRGNSKSFMGCVACHPLCKTQQADKDSTPSSSSANLL